MPSMYELSQEECEVIAIGLMLVLRFTLPSQRPLSDWDVLQLIGKLGRQEDFRADKLR